MQALIRRLLAIAVALTAAAFVPGEAAACTVSGSTIAIGSFSSYAVAGAAQQSSGSAGLQCDVTLALLTTNYVQLRVDSSTFVLTGPGGQSISYVASLTQNGPALTVGITQNLSSLSVLTLFSGAGGSVPLYIRTVPQAALRAGTYTGFVDLRWYYSVCSVGIAICLGTSDSPGLVRPLLGPPTNYGTGAPVRVNIQMIVQNDCIIAAPNATFGSAPLVSRFNPITRTIMIRCSAGAAYTVGLDNGANADSGVRRMRMPNTSNYLRYEIYKTAGSTERWGPNGTARRSSATADSNPGTYDSTTTQGYTYRAAILPGQATPPSGAYADTIRLDVAF